MSQLIPDPRPECPHCMHKLDWIEDEHEFYCPECSRYISVEDLWNWHKQRKDCILCGAGKDTYLGTAVACFHSDGTLLTLQYPMCIDCARNKSLDTILEELHEHDFYAKLVNAGFEIGVPAKAQLGDTKIHGGLIIYV